jgi:hypothetical protein
MRGGSRLRLAGRVRRAHAKVVRSGAEPGGGLLPGSKVGPARCRSVATPVPPKAIAATPVRSSPCFSKRLRRAREDPAFTNSYSRSCLSPSTFSKTAQRRRRRRRRSVQPGGNRAEAAPVSGIVQLTCEYIITPLHFQEPGFGIIASDNSPLAVRRARTRGSVFLPRWVRRTRCLTAPRRRVAASLWGNAAE